MYDVILIGAGVIGCAVARELSRYSVRALVLEREEDVCCGTSKANSAIVHAGYDAKSGSLKAKYNVLGNARMEALCKELDVSFKRIGSLVVAVSEEERPLLEALYQNGLENGVLGLRIIEREELKAMEPNMSDGAIAALHASTAGIVCPFGLTIAYAENAASNGVEFLFDTCVTGISRLEKGYAVTTERGVFQAACVVNAAGVYADALHNMVSTRKLSIVPRRGEYFLLDKNAGDFVRHVIFPLPGKEGKGILVAPTVHGNALIGPNAVDTPDKEGVNTTAEGLLELRQKANKAVRNLPFHEIITSFAGLRAHESEGDFVLGEAEGAEGFFDCAGMASPGLTAAPAIGEHIAELLQKKLALHDNPRFCGARKGFLDPKTLSDEEYRLLLKEKPAYGSIVCRCEGVSEGEILDAIHRPIGAKSLDGLKRRVRVGSGRCQAGFCTPRAMELLARELKTDMSAVTKSGGASRLLQGAVKGGEADA